MIWHSCSLEDVKKELKTDEKTGLSAAEVAARVQTYGENRIIAKSKKNFFGCFIKYISKPSAIIMLAAAAVLLATAAISEKGNIMFSLTAMILIVADAGIASAFTCYTESHSFKNKGSVSLCAKVIRDSKEVSVDVAALVPGDIVILQKGDYIPADGRIAEAYSFICDESTISGDTAPNEKNSDYIFDDMCPVSDRKNMVYSGCLVTNGHATVIVTDTGNRTEMGKQNLLAEQIDTVDTPLKNKIKGVCKKTRTFFVGISVLIFVLGVILCRTSGGYFSDVVFSMLLTSVILSSMWLEESVPTIVAYAFNCGIGGMIKKHIIVKDRFVIEKLNNTSVVISDKTGTLTQNKMRMTMIFDGNKTIDLTETSPDENQKTLIQMGALCGNSRVTVAPNGKKRFEGDPTGAGIANACLKYCNLSKTEIENIYPRMAEVSFDSSRKLMTTVNMINNRPFAIVKGAPDILMEYCSSGNIEGAQEAFDKMSGYGLRVIAVAIKPLEEVPANANHENMECDLGLLGLFGMVDTVSDNTLEAIRECKEAGIKTVMVTGDYITCAKAVAEDMGILKDGDVAVTGEELCKMSDEELSQKIKNISVLSRISAEDKIRVVNAWQNAGCVVALTGDSVEDAKPLRAADIGFAMGVTGTDISKGTADVVLEDDKFTTLVLAIKQARGVYSNIIKSVKLIFTFAAVQLFLSLIGLAVFKELPLNAVQLLLYSGILAIIPVAALGADSFNISKMENKDAYRGKLPPVLGNIITVLWHSIVVCTMALIGYGIGNKTKTGTAVAFGVVFLSLAFLMFECRNNRSLIKEGFKGNKNILISLGISLAAICLICFTAAGSLFGISAASGSEIAYVFLLSSVLPVLDLAVKFVKKHIFINRSFEE